MESSAFHIRPAVPGDFDSLCELIAELDELHRQARPDLFRKQPDGPPRTPEEIAGLIRGPESIIVVATNSAAPLLVGFATILIREVPARRVSPARRIAEIDNLAVRRGMHRQGIGRALVDEAGRWASARGFDALELMVHEFNGEAIAFYDAMGFGTVLRRMRWQPISKA